MLIGLWLCLEGMGHGKLSGIFFSIGPFLVIAGALWFASDCLSVDERSTKSN
jgi:hypothetical protein